MKKNLSVIDFAISLYGKHPELARPVRWPHFLTMAERSGVAVRVVPLSRPARLIRYGQHLCIRIQQELNYHLRALYGMHELCHVWRDEFGEACIYADQDTVTADSREDFADLFAWYVTSEARDYQLPIGMRRARPTPAWSQKIEQLERAGITLGAIAILTSQTEERVRNWRAGKSRPDPATQRVVDRLVSSCAKRIRRNNTRNSREAN